MSILTQAEEASEEDYDDFWDDYADYSEEEEQTNLVSHHHHRYHHHHPDHHHHHHRQASSFPSFRRQRKLLHRVGSTWQSLAKRGKILRKMIRFIIDSNNMTEYRVDSTPLTLCKDD